jgi:hypothetical protein
MASPAGSAEQLPAKLYTCPMAEHADVVQDHPGVCPKCGMTLVETSKVNHGEAAEENWRRQHRSGVRGAIPAMPEHKP